MSLVQSQHTRYKQTLLSKNIHNTDIKKMHIYIKIFRKKHSKFSPFLDQFLLN